MLLKGKRPSLKTALAIYDHTGARFGPLVGLSKQEIDKTARKMAEAA